MTPLLAGYLVLLHVFAAVGASVVAWVVLAVVASREASQ